MKFFAIVVLIFLAACSPATPRSPESPALDAERVIAEALRTNSTVPCNRLSGTMKDKCITTVGTTVQTGDVCESASSPEQCATQYASAKRDPSYCTKEYMSASARDKCFQSLAAFTHNSSMCDEVVDEKKKQSCHDLLG